MEGKNEENENSVKLYKYYNQYEEQFCSVRKIVAPSKIQRTACRGKHRSDYLPCFLQIRRHEENPREKHHCHGQKPFYNHRGFFVPHFISNRPLDDHTRTVNCSPDDKLPTGSVPNSGKKKNNRQIHIHIPPSISSQRYVYIFAKPCAQRNMPSTPELRNGTR